MGSALRRMQALQVFAGPKARATLLERGLRAADVRVISAAAGGPKGLVLNHLDRFIFGQWLATSQQQMHLLGASIGAWRMVCAAMHSPDQALAQMAHDYIHQRYDSLPGKAPSARVVSQAFGAQLQLRFAGREAEVLTHPRYRVHVFTSHGRGLLRREGPVSTPLGYAGAFISNALHRPALARWLERVVFSDPRDPLPLPLDDFGTHQVALRADNLAPAVQASCSIPFWLNAVHDIAGAPTGAYWDGGITDYHLHLKYASMDHGLVLYPHFQAQLIPGWLDKALRHRHRTSPHLSNVVVLAPQPAWVATLPNAKLPDRGDFKAYGDDFDSRVTAWSGALAQSQQLADEFAELTRSASIQALPLA